LINSTEVLEGLKFQAVVFDLDGVITDTAEFHYLGWKRLADELGVPFDREKNQKLRGVSRMESLELVLSGSGLSFSAPQKEELAARKNGYYQDYVSGIKPSDLLPGIERFLKELKQANLKLAIASASKNAFTVIELLKIAGFFDYIVDAAKINRGKPDPELFLKAASGVEITPAKCVGVEDAEAGIAAIKAAGMKAVGVGNRTLLSKADWVADNTSQLSIAAFNRLFA
jgi:beta-phosphoglucomutase